MASLTILVRKDNRGSIEGICASECLSYTLDRVNLDSPVENLCIRLKKECLGIPWHIDRMLLKRGTILLRNPSRTLRSYGVKSGDTLAVWPRVWQECYTPLMAEKDSKSCVLYLHLGEKARQIQILLHLMSL